MKESSGPAGSAEEATRVATGHWVERPGSRLSARDGVATPTRGSVVRRLVAHVGEVVLERVPQGVDAFRQVVVAAAHLVCPEGDDVPQPELLRIRQTDGLRRPDGLERVADLATSSSNPGPGVAPAAHRRTTTGSTRSRDVEQSALRPAEVPSDDSRTCGARGGATPVGSAEAFGQPVPGPAAVGSGQRSTPSRTRDTRGQREGPSRCVRPSPRCPPPESASGRQPLRRGTAATLDWPHPARHTQRSRLEPHGRPVHALHHARSRDGVWGVVGLE